MSSSFNKLQSQRTPHTITAGEVAAGFAVVPVLFDVPFSNINYTAVCTINDIGPAAPSVNIAALDFHNKARTGFDAVLIVFAGSDGENLEVNTLAYQD